MHLKISVRHSNLLRMVPVRQQRVKNLKNFSKVDTCSIPHPKADIFFVLDGSFSTRKSGWKEIIHFVEKFIEINAEQGGNFNYGVLQYSDRVEPLIHLYDEEGNKEVDQFLKLRVLIFLPSFILLIIEI